MEGLPEGFTWTAVADGTVTNVIPGEGEKAENAITEFHIYKGKTEVTDHFTNIDTSAKGNLGITRKTVTVTADSLTRTNRPKEQDPVLTVTIDGRINSDDPISYTTLNREGDDSVGDHPITVTGEANQGNYYVVFVNGILTINDATAPLHNVARVDAKGANGNGWYRLATTNPGPLTEKTLEQYETEIKNGKDIGLGKNQYNASLVVTSMSTKLRLKRKHLKGHWISTPSRRMESMFPRRSSPPTIRTTGDGCPVLLRMMIRTMIHCASYGSLQLHCITN